MPYRLLSTGLPRVRIEDPLNPMTEGVAFAAGNLLQLQPQLAQINMENARQQHEIDMQNQDRAMRQANYQSEASHRTAMEQHAAAALANTQQHQANLLSLQKRQDAIANAAKYGIEDQDQGLTVGRPAEYEQLSAPSEEGDVSVQGNLLNPAKADTITPIRNAYRENETAGITARMAGMTNIEQMKEKAHAAELSEKEKQISDLKDKVIAANKERDAIKAAKENSQKAATLKNNLPTFLDPKARAIAEDKIDRNLGTGKYSSANDDIFNRMAKEMIEAEKGKPSNKPQLDVEQ